MRISDWSSDVCSSDLAFLGVWPTSQVVTVLFTQYALKVGWEVLLTPVTYRVVGWLKHREGLDVYDETTDFTPFSTKVSHNQEKRSEYRSKGKACVRRWSTSGTQNIEKHKQKTK